jgi:hypothetical protein
MPEDETLVRGNSRRRQAAFSTQRAARLTARTGAESVLQDLLTTVPNLHKLPGRRQVLARFRALAGRIAGLQRGGEPDEAPEIAPLDASAAPAAWNWRPIGPSAVLKGQAASRPIVSGRIAGVAVALGGLRVYVASANGGVWRSDDCGNHWRSLMDAWNLHPTAFLSDSLAGGAIAIDPKNPDRIYVGTGEGNGVYFDRDRQEFSEAGAYFGVGPVRSDDGGQSWHTESVALGTLEGTAFYQLAVDPENPESVVGANSKGLYLRERIEGTPDYQWRQLIEGRFTSVVAAQTGAATKFYAAAYGGPVFESDDGRDWKPLGADFPTSDAGRTGLAVQPRNPNVVYALLCRHGNSHLMGLWRLDRSTPDGWQEVTGVPTTLFGEDPTMYGQGSYDLAVAVDPADVDRVYLGGASTVLTPGVYVASLYRGTVRTGIDGPAFSNPTLLGANVHADVHAIEFTPGNPEQLWVGCDGGLFATDTASTTAVFEARNAGLSTLTMNRLGIHPQQDAVLFCGSQDNGTLRYTGAEGWLHSAWGDGGFVVVNWADPYRVLRTYTYSSIDFASDGGASYDSWSGRPVNLASDPDTQEREPVEFYAPLAGTPPSADDADAEVVAFGSIRPWVSTDFGQTWSSIPHADYRKDKLDGTILSMAFASAGVLYAGTFFGGVYRFENQGGWKRTPLHAAPLLAGPVTSIAIDPTDKTNHSIYVTLGGYSDYRHVWHFNGATRKWEDCSGPAGQQDECLLDVQHNSVLVDPQNPRHLYVAADLGVWRSLDAGKTWKPCAYGLPEVAVIDLKLHPQRRLLWAATYGRGVYELAVDAAAAPPVELYVRDTILDRGLYKTVDGVADPTVKGETVSFRNSPDVKIDVPQPDGSYQTGGTTINFATFLDALEDASARTVTSAGGGVNRVYILLHNRGVLAGDGSVMLLLAETPGFVPPLPAGFDAAVRSRTPVNTPHWKTVGIADIAGVRAGMPEVVEIDLPASMLPNPVQPGPSRYCLLALLTSPQDPFTNAETDPAQLCLCERKAAQKNF